MKPLLKYGFFFVVFLLLTQPLLATEKKVANSAKVQNQQVTKKTETSCDWSKTITVVKDILTIIAIIVGAIWTYLLFIKKRQKYPRANISHNVKHVPLVDDQILLYVNVTLTNIGEVLLSLASADVRVNRVLPLSDELSETIGRGEDPVKEGEIEVEWPMIHDRPRKWKEGEFEIEPGESDHLHFEFLLESDIEVVVLYTYFINVKKRERDIGWNLTTVYDLRSSS